MEAGFADLLSDICCYLRTALAGCWSEPASGLKERVSLEVVQGLLNVLFGHLAQALRRRRRLIGREFRHPEVPAWRASTSRARSAARSLVPSRCGRSILRIGFAGTRAMAQGGDPGLDGCRFRAGDRPDPWSLLARAPHPQRQHRNGRPAGQDDRENRPANARLRPRRGPRNRVAGSASHSSKVSVCGYAAARRASARWIRDPRW